MKRLISGAALAGLLAMLVPLSAQEPPDQPGQPRDPGRGQSDRPATDKEAPLTAEEFVTKAASGGQFEVQSSQLALEQSQTEAVREFARQGIELPLVLDDILVNFDQLRTEAAIETLLEFAAQGQQILLFTCHLHLAHQFESRGIEPTWLPGHQAAVEERLAG